MPGYSDSIFDSEGLKNTEVLVDRVLSLPIFPELSNAEQKAVISDFEDFMKT